MVENLRPITLFREHSIIINIKPMLQIWRLRPSYNNNFCKCVLILLKCLPSYDANIILWWFVSSESFLFSFALIHLKNALKQSFLFPHSYVFFYLLQAHDKLAQSKMKLNSMRKKQHAKFVTKIKNGLSSSGSTVYGLLNVMLERFPGVLRVIETSK